MLHFLHTSTVAATEEFSMVSVSKFTIGNEEANITLMMDNLAFTVTDDSLRLSPNSGGGGSCEINVQTTKSLGLICTDLSEGTSYNLMVDLSVGDNCLMIFICFDTPILTPIPMPTSSQGALPV